MRTVVTGVNANGRSCVVDESEIEAVAVEQIPGLAVQVLCATSESPPRPRHYSDALYLISVQRGTIELKLEDDLRTLSTGDCVVMPGIDHAYTAGPGGCQLLVLQIGTRPSS